MVQEGGRIICRPGKGKALVLEMRALDGRSVYTWEINDSRVCYDPLSGLFAVDGEESRVGCGCRELTLIVDDRILEVFLKGASAWEPFCCRGRKSVWQCRRHMWQSIPPMRCEHERGTGNEKRKGHAGRERSGKREEKKQMAV